MQNITSKVVVTSLLKYEKTILILRRSKNSKSYSGFWGGISGFLEKNEDLLSRTIIEIREETQISKENLILRKILKRQTIIIPHYGKIDIQPFCFFSKTKYVKLNWEHDEFKWITEGQISKFKLVPRLPEILTECFKIH